MYTQIEKNKTSQLKANEKFLKDFSAYRAFPDGAENSNLTIDESISLKHIRNDQLLLKTKNLVQKERQINIQVLQHLQEIEKRKLYLDRGFPSLFEYAVKELGYSHSAAYRRIKTMRLCRDIPQATSKIKTGSLNLTTASQLQTFFEKKKRKDRKEAKTFVKKNLVLDACLHRLDTYEESFNSSSTFLPATDCVKENKEQDKTTSSLFECDVQSTFLPAAGCVIKNEESNTKTPTQLNSNQKLDLIKQAENQSSRELEKTLFDIDPEINNAKEKIRNIKNDKVEIKLILDKELQQKLEVLKKLLSHKNPNMSYGELFSVLAEVGLNKYDPKRKVKKQAVKIDKRAENNKADVFDKELRKTSAVTIDKQSNKTDVFMQSKEVFNKKQQKTSAVKIDKQSNKTDVFMQSKEVFNKKQQKTSAVKIDKQSNKTDVFMQSKEVFNKKQQKTSAVKIDKQNNKVDVFGKESRKVTMKKINNDQKYLKPKRYISSKVRHHVWMRDQGKCTYVCPKTKRRCSSDHLLQIDHIKPFSLGGTNEADNLRLLCANHNQFMFSRYQKKYG